MKSKKSKVPIKLSTAQKRRLHLIPQDVKPGMNTVSSQEMMEAVLLGNRGEDWKRDVMLLRAKRAVAQADAGHLSNGELRGVSWFAHLPFLGNKVNVPVFVFDERN